MYCEPLSDAKFRGEPAWFFFRSFKSKGLFDKIVSRLKNVIFEGLMLCVNNCSSKCSDCGYKVRQILMSTAVMVTWFIILDAVLLISYRSSDSLCSLFVGERCVGC